MIKLVVGLGNPGPDYALNRHNIGFMVVDTLARAYGLGDFKRKGQALVMDASLDGHKITLMKPMTFMNRSGQGVADFASFYKISVEQILVIHDELDLPFLKVRIKQGGGHGGHNGLKSLDASIGKDYWRVRIGIDHPGDRGRVTGHVLGNFKPDEMALLSDFLGDFIELSENFVGGKLELFQNLMTLRLQTRTKG